MNSPIKINLAIMLEGSTLVKKAKPEVIRVKTETPIKNGKIFKVKKVKHHAKEPVPAMQYLNINQDAYNHFISEEGHPKSIKPKHWNAMNRLARVDAHCRDICEHIGGIGYDFTILND